MKRRRASKQHVSAPSWLDLTSTRKASVDGVPELAPALDRNIPVKHHPTVNFSRVQRDQQGTTGVQRSPKLRKACVGVAASHGGA
jgi:hypothetical protein